MVVSYNLMKFYTGFSLLLRHFIRTNEFVDDIDVSLDDRKKFENAVNAWDQEILIVYLKYNFLNKQFKIIDIFV